MPFTANRRHSPFIEELQRLLVKHQLSWRKLAELTGYHPSWLSKVRNGTPPSAELVARCDEVLEANGALIALASVGRTRCPAQLPASPAGFVGRHDELRRMRDVLTERSGPGAAAVVAVDGPPGAGKTAAVLHCAHDIVRIDPARYSDGQLYVNLNGYSQGGRPMRPENALEELLIALGVSSRDVPEGIEQRAKLYRSLLASRRILIVLDNASSSEQVEPLLPGSVGCAVMVTSRRRPPVPIVANLSDLDDVGSVVAELEAMGRDFVIGVRPELSVLDENRVGSQRFRRETGLTAAGLLRQCRERHSYVATVISPDGVFRQVPLLSGVFRPRRSAADRTYRLFKRTDLGDRSATPVWMTNMAHRRLDELLELSLLHSSAAATVDCLDGRFGLLDFAGRSFPGWHHHMTLASAAYAYARLSPSAGLPGIPLSGELGSAAATV
ncbi:hypothetical protein E1298_21620 [Actinomadura rubrisoli]|uniref:HTH cro/C1-type domain-containing protein n=2 Tax=Actinomadura rubrisoli TaxID=2530368 RepID=A0A4R5BA06_9ACTN|nr:hypothetical protein E1298_21620 [Actinomadura rubrisoli]